MVFDIFTFEAYHGGLDVFHPTTESTSSTAMSGGQEHHRRSAHTGISPQIPSICIKEDCVEGAWVSGWNAGVVIRSTNRWNLLKCLSASPHSAIY